MTAATARAVGVTIPTDGGVPARSRPDAAPVADRGSVTGWTAVGFAALGAGLLAARAGGLGPGPCALLEATGVPCPLCGLTRLSVHLGHGRLGTVLAGDPAGTALVLALVVVAGAQLLAVARPSADRRWLRSPAVPLGLVGLLALHWLTTLATGLLPSA